MKQIILGVLYDTEKSMLLAQFEQTYNIADCYEPKEFITETKSLYKTKNNRFFYHIVKHNELRNISDEWIEQTIFGDAIKWIAGQMDVEEILANENLKNLITEA